MKHLSAKFGAPFVIFASIALIVCACSQERLKELEKLYIATLWYTKVEASFCTSAPRVAKQKVKYLFVLDKSGSNQPGFPIVAGDITNTDAAGSRRYGPLVQFVQSLAVDPNSLTSFSLINFNDNAAQPTEPNFVNGFDTDRANFISVVRSEWVGVGSPLAPQPDDRGFTNYVSSLQMALQLIKDDAQYEAGSIERPIVTSAYRIIFVSDGVPTVPSSLGVYTQQFDTDILPQIDQILALKDDPVLGPFISDIVLNTAYYFTDTQVVEAETLLQKMANAGNGQYMAFGAGENVLYGAFAPPVRKIRQQLYDVYVENKNAVWWDTGEFLLDTDGDGLPNKIEDPLGGDLTRPDSDGNGVSDLVEYRLSGRPCTGTRCEPQLRNPYSVCAGLKPTTDGAGNLFYPDTDRDGLNDCEEFLLKADRTKFDSNGNFIPDFLEFKAALPFIAGMDESYAQPQADGLTSYEKIKKGLPIQFPSSKVQSFRVRVTSLVKIPRNGGDDRDCFEFKADPVAVLGSGNVLRVYLVENATIMDDKPDIRIAERVVDSNAEKVVFSDEDFQ